MKNINITNLETKCNYLRKVVLELCYLKGGHISSSYSCVEILAAIYYTGFLNVNLKNLNKNNRDTFVLSKGHAAEMLYVILSDLGFFPKKWFKTSYRDNDCKLGGHVNYKIPGIELSTGSLGHGLSFVAGTALASKIDGYNNKHLALLGDAECTAGSVWEAASFISYEKLNNVIAIVDFNKIGNSEFLSEFLEISTLKKKWKSYGWDVFVIDDGNDIRNVIKTLKSLKQSKKKPKVIIAHTIKGKGIKTIENDPIWATRPVSKEVYLKAKKELRK